MVRLLSQEMADHPIEVAKFQGLSNVYDRLEFKPFNPLE